MSANQRGKYSIETKELSSLVKEIMSLTVLIFNMGEFSEETITATKKRKCEQQSCFQTLLRKANEKIERIEEDLAEIEVIYEKAGRWDLFRELRS